MMECIQKTHQRNLHWALIFSLTFSVATTDLLGQSPPITDVAFAPNGKEVVASSQAGLQVYNWPELKLQKTIPISFPNTFTNLKASRVTQYPIVISISITDNVITHTELVHV